MGRRVFQKRTSLKFGNLKIWLQLLNLNPTIARILLLSLYIYIRLDVDSVSFLYCLAIVLLQISAIFLLFWLCVIIFCLKEDYTSVYWSSCLIIIHTLPPPTTIISSIVRDLRDHRHPIWLGSIGIIKTQFHDRILPPVDFSFKTVLMFEQLGLFPTWVRFSLKKVLPWWMMFKSLGLGFFPLLQLLLKLKKMYYRDYVRHQYQHGWGHEFTINQKPLHVSAVLEQIWKRRTTLALSAKLSTRSWKRSEYWTVDTNTM